ncbi:cytidylyltransferase domain-containing protein [Solirubrobacter soli]|uniref:cytidylyltransferase domain-containing protein n=1 Tax=Solirubrobacter soli TaxID=363832 RepID=UPI000411BB57|nr:glycosyltransferase family protein [Solirubrobacter soli]
MRRVVVIQARMTSTRLPGKVLLDLGGKPLLERMIERLADCRRVDEIVIAATTNADDDPIAELAARLGVRIHRGSEHDVLSRYVGAAPDADVVVRLTSDCPLIDAHEVDLVIDALEPAWDFSSNTLERHMPRGLDAEALWRDTLERMDRLATSVPAREHVTWYCREERPDLFLLRSVLSPVRAPDLRWTVDTPEDLELVRRLFDELGLGEQRRPWGEILAHVRAHPELAEINAHVEQKKL